jgi:NAD(P)-dependent dehydrogenase (short-subunit alcohol dehydrogenase family)
MKRIILITGANRGIGLETARQLGQLGHEVIRCARKLESLSKTGENESNLALDVTSPSSIAQAASWVDSTFGKLDVLINNAGIIGPDSFSSVDAEEVIRIMETNSFGPLRTSIAFLPLLRKSSGGRIINISSGMGEMNSLEAGGYAGYRWSKAALNSQTIIAAADLASDGVSVNAVCPGWVRTDMGGAGASRPVEKGAETPVWLATADNIPTGKFFRDKEVISW